MLTFQRPRKLGLSLILPSAGFVLVFVHDYAYRRADSARTGDYELGGLLTHAATDMIAVIAVLTTIAFLWCNWPLFVRIDRAD